MRKLLLHVEKLLRKKRKELRNIRMEHSHVRKLLLKE